MNKIQDPLSFLNFLNNRHSNIKFIIEKQIDHSIAFLDVFHSWTPPPPPLLKEVGGRTFQKLSHLVGGTKHFARKGGEP